MIGVYRIFIGIITAAVLCLPGGAFAASNGCDKEANDRIAPNLALCTTHAFNVGLDRNPTDEAQRQLMRDVIALKTTVMTQQMYKQYEYLDATIKRIKTQLEKAILTTKMQAAGASTSSGGGGSSGSGGAGGGTSGQALSGAYNCINEGDFIPVADCLNRNVGVMQGALANNYTQVRKQLETDIGVFNTWITAFDSTDGVKKIETGENGDEGCKNLKSAGKKDVEKCLNTFRVQVANAKNKYNNKNRQSNAMYRQYGG